ATWYDQLAGVFTELFVAEKMMGLFSLLFGASIALFVERAASHTRWPVLVALWRNALLLGMGMVHTACWDGDVLEIYAKCAPFVILLRKVPLRVLFAIAGLAFALAASVALPMQADACFAGAESLGWYWHSYSEASDATGLYVLVTFYARAFGFMLLGVALYRSGWLRGERSVADYRRAAWIGFSLGVPLCGFALGWQIASGFSHEVAFFTGGIQTLGTLPMTLGYAGLVLGWSVRRAGDGSWLRDRFAANGQMALTNYLMQTAFGVLVVTWAIGNDVLGRAALLLLCVPVWLTQLAWSNAWLRGHANGPFEWIWRCATWLRWQPMRRAAN
ncbi:MAG: hypothetical protein RIT24_1930, partial [Planctomycetota bacterium]